MSLHFFHVKKHLKSEVCNRELIPPQYKGLQFYAYLFQYTLQKRRNLSTITKALRNQKLSYKWGFRTKVIITRDDTTPLSELPVTGFGSVKILAYHKFRVTANLKTMQSKSCQGRFAPGHLQKFPHPYLNLSAGIPYTKVTGPCSGKKFLS